MAVIGWWAETPQTTTPTGSVLTITGGIPQIVVRADRVVTPTGAVLTLTGGRPVINDPQTVTPTGAVLALTRGTPVVTASDRKLVTPTGKSLTVVGGTPVINLHKIVTPTGKSLTVTGGVPVVSVVGPPTFDVVGTGYANVNGNNTCTISPTAGSYGLVGIVVDRTETFTSVKWGGTAMTLLTTIPMPSGNGGNAFLAVYGIANVAGGSTTVAVNTSGAGNAWATFNAVAYKNTSTIGTRTTASGSGSPGSQAVTVTSRTAWFFGGVNANSGGLAVVTLGGGTSRNSIASSISALAIGDSASSVTFTGTSTGMTWWASVAVPLS